MSVDKLNSTAGILAALRGEMAQRGERLGKKAAAGTKATSEAAAAKPSLEVLRGQLAEILRDVPAHDAEAIRAAQSRIVRAVLLAEFGSGLRDHPDWQPILESITRVMQHHSAFQTQIQTLMVELKR